MNTAVRAPLKTDDKEAAIFEWLFRPMGVDGVYARTRLYEDVIDGLQRLFTRHRPPEAEVFRFPPVMSRRQLETSGYLNSFPQLLGCVCCLHGNEKRHFVSGRPCQERRRLDERGDVRRSRPKSGCLLPSLSDRGRRGAP